MNNTDKEAMRRYKARFDDLVHRPVLTPEENSELDDLKNKLEIFDSPNPNFENMEDRQEFYDESDEENITKMDEE